MGASAATYLPEAATGQRRRNVCIYFGYERVRANDWIVRMKENGRKNVFDIQTWDEAIRRMRSSEYARA